MDPGVGGHDAGGDVRHVGGAQALAAPGGEAPGEAGMGGDIRQNQEAALARGGGGGGVPRGRWFVNRQIQHQGCFVQR